MAIKVGDKAFGNGAFEPIPTGTRVNAVVFDVEKSKVKSGDNAGKDQAVVTFKITDGDYKGRELRYNNIPLYDGKNAFVLVTFAEAVGWKVSKEEGIEVPDNLNDVLGKPISIKVGQRASTKVNPETGEPYVNNTAGGYQKVKKQADKPAAEKPSWGNL